MSHKSYTRIPTALIIMLFVFLSINTTAQVKKDACALLSDQQINTIIGCNVKQSGTAMIKGIRCLHKSADAKSDIVLEYYDWHSEKTASDMMKLNHDDSKKKVAENKKAIDIYTAFKDFPEAGSNALILTGEGNITTDGNVVRIQFLIGTVIITVDTRGIDKNKVVPKAKEIYNAIISNNK